MAKTIKNDTCVKCGDSNWGYYSSSSTGKMRRYCRTCRQERAKKYNRQKNINGGYHTKREWENKLAQYDRCPGCDLRWEDIPKRPDKRYKYVWTKDHKIPINKGGPDDIENIQPLCYRCNSSKCDNI